MKMSVNKKKKHVSKKNKKDWRKHCDIRDVEEFLEDQRLEERLGKFATKSDSELFVIDTGGVEDQETVASIEKPVITNKQQKRALLSGTPKCFEVLLSTSKVTDPNAKRNHVNPFGKKPTALSKLTENRRLKKGVFEKRLDVAKKNRKMALEKRRKAKQNRQNFSTDLWGESLPEAKGVPVTLCDEFISIEAQLHNVLPERRLRAKPPVADKLLSTPAVAAPHPGISYNPTYQEHQALLQQVVDREQKVIQKEARLHRATTRMFSRVTATEKENQWRIEMSAGLPETGKTNEEENPEENSDNEYKAINPPVKNKKKDHKARRKQKERLVEMERLKRKKIDKKKITDLYKLRKLQSSIERSLERQTLDREGRRERRAARVADVAPLLSAHRVPPSEPELVEAAALTGDLRNVGCDANLLRDRYESLQRRGALAGARVMMNKRRKVKSYFKAGHKVTDQEVERYLARVDVNK